MQIRTGAQVSAILAAAAVAAAVSNLTASTERRLDWIRSAAAGRTGTAPPNGAIAQPLEFSPHPGKAWLEATPEEIRLLFDRGAPFFDARRSAVYREGHIKGARSVSVWEAGLDGRLGAIADEHLDPSAPIVVYCSGGDCEDSHMLAERLWGIGLNNVLVYRDGFPDWERRGWPVSKGSAP